MKKLFQHYLVVIVHKFFVARGLFDLAFGLMWRAITHDLSKFHQIEASEFAQHTPMLRVVRYGSDEYKRILTKLKGALDVHYGKNRHHPEHWKYGLHEMDAVDLCEMLCDWEAASKMSPGGSLINSVDHNEERFHTGSIMADVFRNTAMFRWGSESEWKRTVCKWSGWLFTAASIIVPAWWFWPLPLWVWIATASTVPVTAICVLAIWIKRRWF